MIALCLECIVVLASKKKVDFVKQAEAAAADEPDSDVPPFELLVRDKVTVVIVVIVLGKAGTGCSLTSHWTVIARELL